MQWKERKVMIEIVRILQNIGKYYCEFKRYKSEQANSENQIYVIEHVMILLVNTVYLPSQAINMNSISVSDQIIDNLLFLTFAYISLSKNLQHPQQKESSSFLFFNSFFVGIASQILDRFYMIFLCLMPRLGWSPLNVGLICCHPLVFIFSLLRTFCSAESTLTSLDKLRPVVLPYFPLPPASSLF